MALVRSLEEGHQNLRVHPSAVDCTWQAVIGADGTTYLQLSSFGSDTRQSAPKTSQTLQFDEEHANLLAQALSSVFPGLAAKFG